MKFTSEDLLNAMGLKVGYKINLGESRFKILSRDNNIICAKCDKEPFMYAISLVELVDREFEIIQPKPTLTEDEKVILRNVDEKWKWIARDKIGTSLCCFINKPTRTYNGIVDEKVIWCDIESHATDYIELPYIHLFQFIKWEDEPYPIEELLGERE